MKCRRKDPQCEIVEYEVVEMKNGSKAAKGKCAECGTGMYKMLARLLGIYYFKYSILCCDFSSITNLST